MFRTTATCGKRAASISSVPSLDALSTTIVSTGTVWASMLATASASSPQAFNVGMTTTARMRTRHDTRMLRVVMWSTDPVGKQMAGPGIRYHRLATELAGRFR